MFRSSRGFFLAFTAVFAVLVAFVFWGTWSPDFAPVMPDNTTVHSMAYGDTLATVIRKFWTSGRFIPSDLLWDGLLISPYFCQELKYAVALYCAGLGLAYFLLGRGLKPLAAYGAGLLLSFCGYWSSLFSAGHGGWFVWMTYGVFAFGLVDRAVRLGERKHWIFLGACVGWGGYYQPDLWLLFSFFTAVYFLWCCLRERKLPWKGALISLAVFLIIGLPSLVGAAASKEGREEQIARKDTLSASSAAKDDDHARWIFVTNWSLPPDETVEFVVPRANGDTSCPLTLSIGRRFGSGIRLYTGALGRPIDAKEGNYRQHSLYVGWLTCLFALLGVAFGFRRREVVFFAAAALLFYLLSLGRYFEPLYRLVFALPIGDSIRCPVKWHHLTELSLLVLSGYGLDAILQRLPERICRVPSVLLVGLLVLFAAFDLARVDRVFCAPVDLRQVRQTNSEMQMSVLRRQDFSNPQVADLVRRGRIVSLANYLGNPDLFLVEMLTPRKPMPLELPPMTRTTWFGFLSLFGTLAVVAYAILTLRKRC